jgi:hypothetical protein
MKYPLIHFWKALLYRVEREPEEIDNQDISGFLIDVAAVSVLSNVKVDFRDSAKAKVSGLITGYDKSGSVQLYSWAA